MADKPLDCIGVQAEAGKPTKGKHDHITFDDKEHKIKETRIAKEGSIKLAYLVTEITVQ